MKQKNKLLFNKICEISPVSFEIFDLASGQLISINDRIWQHLGYSQEEIVNLQRQEYKKVIHADDLAVHDSIVNEIISDPRISYKEGSLRLKKKDGTYINTLMRLATLERDEFGRPKAIFCAVSDTSEIVMLKDALEKELKKLEVISFQNNHNLRGPVATILGLIQLIEHDNFDGAHAREIIGLLKKTVIKLDDVIRQINESSY